MLHSTMICVSLTLLASACVAMDVDDAKNHERVLRNAIDQQRSAPPPSPRLRRDSDHDAPERGEEQKGETPFTALAPAQHQEPDPVEPQGCSIGCVSSKIKDAARCALGVAARGFHALVRPCISLCTQLNEKDEVNHKVRELEQRLRNRDEAENAEENREITEAILAQSRGCNGCGHGCGRDGACNITKCSEYCPCCSNLLCKASFCDRKKPCWGCKELPWDAEQKERNDRDLFPPEPTCFGKWKRCPTPWCEKRYKKDPNDEENSDARAVGSVL